MNVRQRVSEGEAEYEAMKSMWRIKEVGMRAKKGLYESIVVPTVLYGGQSWGLTKAGCHGDELLEEYVQSNFELVWTYAEDEW